MLNESKRQKLKIYDPNGIGVVSGKLFGLPFNYDESDVILLPVPWEVTTSYGGGTAKGPKAILDASPQLDLYDGMNPTAWQSGFFMKEISNEWQERSEQLKILAGEIIAFQEQGGKIEKNLKLKELQEQVNTASEELNKWVYEQTKAILESGKRCGVVGGDHSVPYGFIMALAGLHESFGILHIDAHADLRDTYEGFTYSHASIMHNVLKLSHVERLVQVGIRDISPGEAEVIKNSAGRIKTFYDKQLKEQEFRGGTWHNMCESIMSSLPEKVYISFDIDGLNPALCPATGTPVPGGLSFEQASYLLEMLAMSGKEIIGFDLCEVAPGEGDWNGNVGARLLYKLCLVMSYEGNR